VFRPKGTRTVDSRKKITLEMGGEGEEGRSVVGQVQQKSGEVLAHRKAAVGRADRAESTKSSKKRRDSGATYPGEKKRKEGKDSVSPADTGSAEAK